MGRLIQADRSAIWEDGSIMPCYHCAGWWCWCIGVGMSSLYGHLPILWWLLPAG